MKRVVIAISSLVATITVVGGFSPAAEAASKPSTTATVYEVGDCPQALVYTTVKLRKGHTVRSLTQDFYDGNKGTSHWLGTRRADVHVRPSQTTVGISTCVPMTMAHKPLYTQIIANQYSGNIVPFTIVKVRVSGDC